jgi:alpha-1,6-mannosyltransferase
MSSLTFCDVTTLYCPTGGGIRTYYDAKLDWFRRQCRHRYVLIIPGRHSSVRTFGPSVTVVKARGLKLTRAEESYRLLADWSHIRSAVRACQPDVLEAGDPWVSGPFLLWARHHDNLPAVVASFFHSDPIPTYVAPALARSLPSPIGRAALRFAGRAFYRLQASYDVTMVSCQATADRLRQDGVTRSQCAPLGADSAFFEVGSRRLPVDRPRRLLYAGRLDRDKQIDLLIAILPRLLDEPGVSVTVAGTGALQSVFERFQHPRFRFAGYVSDRAALARLYRDHDVFLSPGAYETFGLAALEAAAAGLVVVGPDHGGTGALLGDMPAPLVFTAGDSEDFLRVVRRALQADSRCASRASCALASRYGTWSQAIGRLIDRYERIVETSRCRN